MIDSLLKNAQIWRSSGAFPDHWLKFLKDDAEAENVAVVSSRDNTQLIGVTNTDTGELIAYVVLGVDENDMVTIYAARVTQKGAGGMFLRSMFDASVIVGKSFRVHSEKQEVWARFLGVDAFEKHIDTNGVPQLVVRNG